jgi:carbon dioxide concentrating mechanism protein CcmO
MLFIEVGGWSPAMVILDAVEKSAGVRILQTELNDQPGVCLKLTGTISDVKVAAETARALAHEMQVPIVVDMIAAPAPGSRLAYDVRPDFNPLLEQTTIQLPSLKETHMPQNNFAVGLIETQGFTAVFEAVDTALKAASVEVIGREKLGGGYITVVIKGDVAAVQAAVEAAKGRVEGLGRLIAAHVIPSPSEGVLAILPKLG